MHDYEMVDALKLNLNDVRELDIKSQAKNIVNDISEAFSNAMKKGTEKIDFPDNLGEKVKSGLEKIDLKEIGGNVAEEALKTGMKSLGMKSTTFTNLKNIFMAIKEGDLKKGLSSGFNVAINLLKVPKEAKTLIKNGKDLILEQTMGDELKRVMKKQQNTISRINKKCETMEEAFNKNDFTTLDKTYKLLKKDMDKVMPIQDVLNKGNSILNRYELMKSKGMRELTQDELSLCNKLTV